MLDKDNFTMADNTIIKIESSKTKRDWFRINMDMLPAKIVYLLADASMGCTLPFYNLFYVSQGLNAADAGLISGITSIFSFLSSLVWGRLSDYTGRRKLIFVVLCLGSILTIFPLPWVAKAVVKMEKNITCIQNSTYVFDSIVQNKDAQCFISRRLLNPRELFYVLLGMTAISNFFYSGLISFTEGLVMNVVTNSKSKTTFGPQKVFAPIGYGLGSFISGIAVDHYKGRAISQYAAAFYIFLPCVILLIPIGIYLVGHAKFESKNEGDKVIRLASQFKLIFKNHDNILFFLSIFVSGMLLRIYYGFSFLFMQDEMHLSKTMMSNTVVICMASELLIYPFSSRIIKFFGGNIPSIIIGLMSYFPRFMIISYAKNAQVMLPVQILHGIGLSLPWICFLQHANEIFPKEIVMTVIMVMATFHFTLSGTISSVISGFIYHKFGGRQLYRGGAILAATWSIFLMLYYGIRYQTKRGSKHSSSDKSKDKELNVGYTT